MTRSFRQSVFVALLFVTAWAPAASASDGQPGIQTAEGGLLEAILFCVFGGLTLISALGVALSRRVVRMAVWLFITLGSVAMLFFLMAANFVAAIQLIVYVGGTLILLIFGVMLTTKSPQARFTPKRAELLVGGLVCLLLFVAFVAMIGQVDWPQEPKAQGYSMAEFGRELLTTYLVPFEAASVLLLVVMIGAAYLARQEE